MDFFIEETPEKNGNQLQLTNITKKRLKVNLMNIVLSALCFIFALAFNDMVLSFLKRYGLLDSLIGKVIYVLAILILILLCSEYFGVYVKKVT